MRLVTSLLALSIAVPCGNLTAQQAVLEPGTRVRVWAQSYGVDALIGDARIERDTLHLWTKAQLMPLAIPVDSLERLDISRGDRSHWLVGAGVGLAAGVAAGAAIGGLTGEGCEGAWRLACVKKAEQALYGAMVSAPAGLLLGVIVGGLMKGEHWEQVDVDQLRIRPLITRRQFGLAVSVGF